MKENTPTISSSELRKNLITGAFAVGMLGLAFGIAFQNLGIGGIVGILVGLAVGFRISQVPIKIRYPLHIIRRVLIAAGLVGLLSTACDALIDRGWTGMHLLLVAILPIAAWAWLVITLAMAITSLDELQRRIQTEAIAIGFAGTAIVCGGYSLLELAGFLPALNWGLVVFIMVFMWFIGKMWTLWRYR